MRLSWRRRLLLAGALLTALAPAVSARAAGTLKVAYAGSMGVVMDRDLGPSFAAAQGAAFQGTGQGAIALARLLAAGTLHADVFVSVGPGPIKLLQKAGLVVAAVPVASTQMVIAYSPKGVYAHALQEAANGKVPWWKALEMKGLRFGRTDPHTDPQGQNIVFTMLLAGLYYQQPTLAARVLGPVINPAQIFSEPSLLSRLEQGQLDAASGYRSAVLSHHLPFIPLPDEINLGDPAQEKAWYSRAQFDLPGPDGKTKTLHPAPLVFYAAVLKNAADPDLAQKFMTYLTSPDGQKVFGSDGYDPPRGGNL